MHLSFLFNSSFKYFIREYSWWSTHPTQTAVGTFIFFTIITIIIGIIIVCFTQPKSSGMIAYYFIFKLIKTKERFVTIKINF
jgi:hypothetical protein